MKGTGRAFLLTLLAIATLGAACTGSEAAAPVVEATATAVPVATEAPTALPTAVPETPTAIPEPTSDELIEATTATLDANGVGDLIAWDVLHATVRGDGLVALTLCGWTGETVFDNVYTSLWEATGQGEPVEVGTSITSGDCLNTHLVDTALEFTREFDNYRNALSADPALFPADDRRLTMLADEVFDSLEQGMAQRVEDGITGVQTGLDGALPDSAVAPILVRRVDSPFDTFELVACRIVNQEAGLYRDDVLVSSSRDGSDDGPHAVDVYQLVRRDQRWQLLDSSGVGFADCFLNNDWLGDVSDWKPGEAWIELR